MSGEIRKSEVVSRIALTNESEQTKYKDNSKEKVIQFESKNNNGNFTVGSGDSTLILQWYVVNTDTVHIRAGNGEKVGYLDNYIKWLPNEELSICSFSSFIGE